MQNHENSFLYITALKQRGNPSEASAAARENLYDLRFRC